MALTPTTVEINGYALRKIRVLSGIGVADLARQVGTTRSYIAKLELGHNRRVSPAVYNALLEALDIQDRRTLLAAPNAVADTPTEARTGS